MAFACGLVTTLVCTAVPATVRAQQSRLISAENSESRATRSYTPRPYKVVEGIRYGDRSDQRLDLLYPVDRNPVGVIVWAHGGGWVAGNRRQPRTQLIARWLIDQGWVIASFDYRLTKIFARDGNTNTFPAAIADAIVAARWVEENAAKRNLGGRILLGGWSAGGNIATMASVVNPDKVGVRTAPPNVDGVLSVGGITDMWAMYNVHYSFYSFIAAKYVDCQVPGSVISEDATERCDNTTLRSRLANAGVAHHLRRAIRNEQYVPPLYVIAGERDPLVRPDTQATAIVNLWTQLTDNSSMAVADVMPKGAHDPKFGEFNDVQLRGWLGSVEAGTIAPYREVHLQCHFLSRRSCVSMYGLARR